MLLDEAQILKIMHAAGIPGCAIAMIGRDGKISTVSLGTSGCSFFKMDALPSETEQRHFDSSRYLLTKQGFYYYNHSNKTLQKITDDQLKLHALDQHFKNDKQIFALADEQHKQIKQMTGHQPERRNIQENTVFGAASLSKPVFAYLILKLIAKQSLVLADGVTRFDLDIPLYKILPGLSEGGKNAEKLTARMVLAHTTGIPMSTNNKLPSFLFAPGTAYAYNGVPYLYLQMAIENLTGRSLQQLANEYVFKPLLMTHSSFLRAGFRDAKVVNAEKPQPHFFPIDFDNFPANSANSLRTTASDYALFMQAWMNDEELALAFKPKISMTKDNWAVEMKIPDDLLQKIDWGLGVGLQQDDNKNVTGVFHIGDMNQWRAVMVMDPVAKTAAVFFTNGPNGDILAEEITSKIMNTSDCLRYISEKFAFATKFEDHWEENQTQRVEKVDAYFSGMHASEAEWVAEEADFADKKERMMQFKGSLQSVRENLTDTPNIQAADSKCTITPLKMKLTPDK